MLWITRLSGRLSTLTMDLLVAPVYAVRVLLSRPALTQLSPWAPEKLKQSVEESQAIGRAPNGRNLPNTLAVNPSFYQTHGGTDLASPGCHP